MVDTSRTAGLDDFEEWTYIVWLDRCSARIDHLSLGFANWKNNNIKIYPYHLSYVNVKIGNHEELLN